MATLAWASLSAVCLIALWVFAIYWDWRNN